MRMSKRLSTALTFIVAFFFFFSCLRVGQCASSSSFCDIMQLNGDSKNPWKTVFLDVFDSNAINATNWNVVEGKNVGACRDAVCMKENVFISQAMGGLVLKSDRSTSTVSNDDVYTTGAVTTFDKVNWHANKDQEFRVCVQAMLPGGGGNGLGQGIWPAHWLMPNDHSCDPDEGEMDIMEMVDGNGKVYSTYHWETTFPKENCSYPKGHQHVFSSSTLPTDWDTQFHEFAVERGNAHLVFATDNRVTLNTTTDTSAHPLFWNVPWYLILNTAVGGSWPGNPTPTTKFPTYHIIRKVHVITRASSH